MCCYDQSEMPTSYDIPSAPSNCSFLLEISFLRAVLAILYYTLSDLCQAREIPFSEKGCNKFL